MWGWQRGNGREWCCRPGAWLLIAAAVVLMSDPVAADPSPESGREIWAGADISDNVWLLYSGVTLAPWSSMHEPGFRFRSAGGYGGYSYDRDPDKTPDPSRPRATHLTAQTYFADVLVGYLARYGELTAKGFIGAAIISHDISPTDEETVAIGEEVGVKGVVELWLNIGERGWGSLDVSWASAHNTRTARTRLGYRVWPKLSLGLEAGINLDSQGECRMQGPGTSGCKLPDGTERAGLLDYGRAGVFARYEWGTSEASVGVGVLGDSLGDDGTEISPYVTVNWLTQF
jgi:hypothetical protein